MGKKASSKKVSKKAKAPSYSSEEESSVDEVPHIYDYTKNRLVIPDLDLKYNGTNGYSWMKLTERSLVAAFMGDHLTDNSPPTDKLRLKLWRAEEAYITNWMVRNMEVEQRNQYYLMDVVADIWREIRKSCAEMQNDWRVYDLLLQVKFIRQKELSVAPYASHRKAIWREIDQLWPVSIQNTEYWQRETKVRTLTFLMGLNSEYESLRAQLIHREKFPTLEEAISEATSADCRKKIKTPEGQSSVSVAHAVKKEEPKEKVHSSKHVSKETNDTEPVVCAYCTKPGHHIKECRKLAWKEDLKKKGLWNPGAKKKAYVASSSNQEEEVSKKENGDVQKLIAEEVEKVLKKFSSSSLAQSGKYKHMSIAFTTYENLQPELHEWILDSGATDHMSPDKACFEEYKMINDSHLVFTANGGILKVAGIGKIRIKEVLLQNVLHVPGLKANLLSLQRLVDDTGWRFIFDSSYCFLYEKETGQKTLSARRKRGLLLVDGLDELDGLKGQRTLKMVFNTQSKDSISLLHRRLGHPSFHLLKQVYPDLFKNFDIQSLVCDSCQFAKHRRSQFPKTDHRKNLPFDMVHSEVWGPCFIPRRSHHKWFIIFVDDYSRYSWIYLLKNKSEVPSVIVRFIELIYNQFDKRIRSFRSDNAREYFSSEVNQYMNDHGIVHESSCVNTPQQNGLAERKIGHIISSARSLLFQGNCPKTYWSDAVATAVHLINRMPSRTLSLRSPIDLLASSHPELSLSTNLFAKVFGCVAYVHSHLAGKLDPRAIKCIFVGYSSTQKGYVCYHPLTKKTFVTADVKFDEYNMFYNEGHRSEDYLEVNETDTDMASLELHPSEISSPAMDLVDTAGDNPELEKETTQMEDEEDIQAEEDISAPTNQGWSIAVSKGTRECRSQKLYPTCNYVSYDRLSSGFRKIVQALLTTVIPRNVQDAMSQVEWKTAMDEEMLALRKNSTWDMGPLPEGKKLVGSRWVYTIKHNSDGSIARYKARLVARGYTQSYGIDYNETFAPVAKLNTVRLVIALASMHQWDLSQFDVKNAFLHGELEEEVYMAPPPGYQLHENSSYVCHLKKSLYGLKQSPRAWFEKFSSTLISAGYSQSEGDHTLFFKHGQDSKLAILIVYVDDIIVTGDDVKEIGNLKRHLTSNFDIKSLGQLTYFLGIEVAYSRAGVVLSQHKYILDLLKDTGKLDCKPVSTPVDTNVKLQAKQSDKDDPINKPSFQRLIGRLLYLNHTRPDISFAVNSLSQYMSDPRQSHQTAADRILSYLKGTIGTGLLFHAGGDPTIKIFTDSDYASSLDDSRSTSGYCSFLGKSLITWRSKK